MIESVFSLKILCHCIGQSKKGNINSLALYLRLRRKYLHLRTLRRVTALLQGRRVLIIGSGPSLRALSNVPPDVVICACKDSPLHLIDQGITKVDLFFWPRVSDGTDIVSNIFSKKIQFKLLLIADKHLYKTLKKNPLLRHKTCRYDSRDIYMLSKLISPATVEQIKGRARSARTSVGMKALQYALMAGAREIYLCGIDLGRGGYFNGNRNRTWTHQDIDDNFIKIVSKKYSNIFSLSPSSPITAYVKHRKITPDTNLTSSYPAYANKTGKFITLD